MRRGTLYVWIWVFGALIVQLLVTSYAPGFARTCDLLILLIVALALAREPAVAVSAALLLGLMVDALSVHFVLLHTMSYGVIALALSMRRPYAYMTNRSLLPGIVLGALAVKVISTYLWATIFVMPLSPVYLFRLSYLGILALLLVSYFFGIRLVRSLKEPEVLDFEVG